VPNVNYISKYIPLPFKINALIAQEFLDPLRLYCTIKIWALLFFKCFI